MAALDESNVFTGYLSILLLSKDRLATGPVTFKARIEASKCNGQQKSTRIFARSTSTKKCQPYSARLLVKSLLAIANEKVEVPPNCQCFPSLFVLVLVLDHYLRQCNRALTATLAHGQLGPRKFKKRNFTTAKRWKTVAIASTVWRRWLHSLHRLAAVATELDGSRNAPLELCLDIDCRRAGERHADQFVQRCREVTFA